ncbi:cytochrome P450 81Q32-like [Euphorbia lathyris]|uniref:cytochrome P450 81Q32-like n=1 Tax=Euphorbia lathyris TaxID=212925 RepID=UPI0033139BC1
MEAIVLIICFVFLLVAYKIFFNNKRNQYKKLPPSPPALPVIGHLHILKQPIHRSLHNLSQKFGPIFYLWLGSRPAVVISSPSAVEECFTKNDIVLANRPLFILGKYLGYNHTSIATSPYGDHWRNLRRISAVEIFSTNRLNKFSSIRRDEMEIFLKKLFRISSNYSSFAEVKELRQMFSELTFGIIMRMVTGKRYGGEVEKAAEKFRETIAEIFVYADVSYPGDFLPFLEWIDYQGYSKKMKELAKRSDKLLNGLIEEQRNDMLSNNSMISHLLSLQQSQPDYYTDEIIKGIIMDILLAGTESSALTIEWAMSNLLNHPQVLNKAKNEIDKQIGQEKLLDESEIIPKLPYLQNTISETFRLYPAGPLLLPHLSQSECTIGGFNIPKDTIIFINAWSMQRDPKLWDDAATFKPERFQENQGENFNYKYMPFGLGRRACPGMGLANRVVGFALGCMIQCFEWKRVDDHNQIDMREGVGLTMPKAYPLEALCKPRDIMKTFSSPQA